MNSRYLSYVEMRIANRTVIGVPVISQNLLRIVAGMAKQSVAVMSSLCFESVFFVGMWNDHNLLSYGNI